MTEWVKGLYIALSKSDKHHVYVRVENKIIQVEISEYPIVQKQCGNTNKYYGL